MKQPEWKAWVGPLNDRAGLTLVVIATCQECGQIFPASPRMRVFRCPPCRETIRKRRYQKVRTDKTRPHGSPESGADAQPARESVFGVVSNDRIDRLYP